MRSEDAGWVRCLRAISQTAPGRLRASCPLVLRPVRGVLPLDWDRRKAGNAARAASQETWPEVEKPRPRDLGQSRGGAPRGERADRKARAASERCGSSELR